MKDQEEIKRIETLQQEFHAYANMFDAGELDPKYSMKRRPVAFGESDDDDEALSV